MKEFVIKSSRSVGIMAILGFVLFVGLVLSVDEALLQTILPGSSGAIILRIIALGTVWGLVGRFLSRKPSETYSPEQLKAQHTWLAIVLIIGAIFLLLGGSIIPAIILTIGAVAEWYNREQKN